MHGRLCREVNVSLEEAQAILAALVLMAGDRNRNAAFALADLLSRRGLERPCETLVACARALAWGQRAELALRPELDFRRLVWPPPLLADLDGVCRIRLIRSSGNSEARVLA